MAFNDAAVNVGSNAIESAITHMQLHSGARGAAGTSNVVGDRAAVTGSVDADGDITLSASWSGLPASQAVAEVSYWSDATGGTYYGGVTNASGDAGANAAGEFSFTATENTTAS